MLEENLNQAEQANELNDNANNINAESNIDDELDSSESKDSVEVSKEEEQENDEKPKAKVVEEEQVHFLPHDHYQYQLFEIQKTYKMDGFRTGAVDVRIIDFHERNKILNDLFYRKSIYDLIKNNCFPTEFNIKSYKFDQEKKGWEYTVHVKYEDYRDALQQETNKLDEITSETEQTCDDTHVHNEHCSHNHDKKHKKQDDNEENESEKIYDSDDEAFSAKTETGVEIKENEEVVKIEEPTEAKETTETPTNETDTWDSL